MEEVDDSATTPSLSYSSIISSIPSSPSGELEEVDLPSVLPPPASATPTYGLVLDSSSPVLHVFGAFGDNKSYSPISVYPEVILSFVGGGTYTFNDAQEDSGCDAGLAISLQLLLALGQNKPGWLKYVHKVNVAADQKQQDSLTVVCEVEIPSIGLKTYTTVVGMPGIPDKKVLVGRFMVGDAQNRLTCGVLANPISLPLSQELLDTNQPSKIVTPGSYTLTKCPSFPELQQRFLASSKGKEYVAIGEGKKRDALELYKGGAHVLALENFQWLSVYGVFMYSKQDQDSILYNMGKTEAMLRNFTQAKFWLQTLLERHPTNKKYVDSLKEVNDALVSK